MYELSRNLKRRGFLFTAVGIPILGFLLFFGVQLFANRANEDAIEDLAAELEFDFGELEAIGYVDESGLFDDTGALASGLRRFPSRDEAQTALEDGELDAYYVILPDYVAEGNVLLVLPEFSPARITPEPVEQLLLSLVSDEVTLEALARLRSPAAIEQVEFQSNLGEAQARNEGSDFALVYGFAIIFAIALFTTNGYLMQSVIEEKETRLVEILITSVKARELLTGKILAMGVLGLLQMLLWLGTILILSQIASSLGDLPSVVAFLQDINLSAELFVILIVYFVLGYLYFAAVFGAIGALSNSLSEGPSFTAVFILPIMIPFFSLSAFLESPNAAGPVIMSIVPFTSPLAMAMRLALVNVPLTELALSIGLLAALDGVMIWLAGRLFRANSLLAGKVPKIRDIPALLRG
jgi:ABC-2 type transport system permease protein